MATGKALDGMPYAGNPHVAPSQCYGGTSRFDEGEVAPACTAAIETEGRNSPSIAQGLPKLRRVPCRRQPEGRASGCATPRRGSLLYRKAVGSIVAFAFASAAFAGGNLLKNGDFESGKADGWGGWGGGESRIEETSPHGGKYCFSFEHRTNQKGGWRKHRVAAKPSSVYTVSGYVRGDAGTLKVKVFFYDEKCKYISETDVFSSASAPDWMYFEKAVKTPGNTANIMLGLHVAEGVGWLDDISVVEGDCVKTVVNEILNSSFGYSLHESGMPEYWNSGGGYSFFAFRPGVHEGRYFRVAPEEKSPVPGTKVVFVDDVGWSEFMTGPLAGDTDYVFSVYMRSDKDGAKVKLGTLSGRNITPGEKEFALAKEWRRLVMPFRLKNTASQAFYAAIKYQKNPIYMAAPMLHIGREAVQWRPNPADANLPDLRKGRPAEAAAQPVRELTVPEADEGGTPFGAVGATIYEFYPLGGGETISGKYRAALRQSDGVLFCDVECDSGAKPFVPREEHVPLVAGNDAAELFISPSETGVPYMQFMGGRNGDFAATLGAQGKPVNDGWTYDAAETEKGWRCTYRIPLSLFKEPGGKVWRINVGITDFDGLKPRYFSATRGAFHEPRQYLRVKGLPQGDRMVPPRIAAERDLYISGEDVVRIRTFDVKEPAAVKLIDESGKVLLGHAERVDRVDIANLPNGKYRIVVEAANGKGETHFRKNVAAKSHSRVNRFTKNIEVDGRPFFPMVYTWLSRRADMPTEWHISELKKRNFNTILFTMETFSPRFGYTPDDRRRLLRIFADAGFRFILWTSADIKKSGTFAVAEAHRKYLGELGAELLDRVVGWYYLDEIAPVFWEKHFNIRESDIAPGYRADKAVDPDRLHFINWNCSNVVEGQKFFAEDGATDLYSLDSYPYRNSINYGALAAFERAANAIGHRIDNASLPGIMWLQTYSYQEGLREPMPVEYRNNVYVGLVNHVSGFMNFIGCPENGDLWDEMGRAYGTALKWLEMTVQPGAKRLSKGKVGNIAYALWERGDGGYGLVAVNTSYSPQKETLSFGVEFGKTTNLIGGEGILGVGRGGTITVSLPVAGSAAWFIDGCAKNAAPVPQPPFAESGRSLYRPKTEMSADKIVSGSKALIWSSGVRGNSSALSLLIDEQSVASVRIHSSPEAGWNPLTTFTTDFSPATGVVRTCPFRTTKTAGGTFRQRIFATPEGKATFTVKYEMDDYTTLKGPGVYISMPAPVCFGRSITAYDAKGKSKRYVLPDTIEKWCDGKPKPWINCFQAKDPVRIAFDEEHPARSFALEFEPGTCRSLVLFRAAGTMELYFGWHDQCRFEETPITVDFGFSSRGVDSPCVVNGVNFTANNDFSVPCYDPNGNYLVNPSLESGARYFHNVPSGQDVYAQIVEGDAHSGRFALRGGCKTFNFPTVTGRDYVFSFWAKSTTGKRAGGGVSADTYLWKRASTTKWWGVGTEWERVEYVVTNWQYRAIAFMLEQCPGVLFDDFQFEEGRKATPYRGNPLGIELKTDVPDDFFAPPGIPFNARLVVRGPSTCRGKIAYSVVDVFGRKTGEGALPFDLSKGEQTLPAFDEAFFAQKGVYAIRLNVSGEGFLPYFDCVRLARFAYADAPAPNRRLHHLHGITWPTKAQTNDFTRIRRQYNALGLQPRATALSGHAGDFPPELGHAIIAKNASWGFPTAQHLFYQKRMDATGWKEATSATDELVAKVSAIVEDTVREYAEVTEWYGPSEVSGWVRMCQERNWKEYAKLMRAAHDAVHRANPKATYSCYGTCNLGEQGRSEILAFLAAAKEMWPDFLFDTVDVHPYRPHPEFPDYDADWKALLDGLDALGYGGKTVVAAEGGYFMPICCQPWGGIAPWAPTLVKDSYSSQHLPSFDIGWGERVSAAMMLRYNLVSYKYGSRISCATSWGTTAMDSRNPISRHVTAAAQLELLGSATFIEDVRFAPGARAYVFDDHAGHAVAAFWRFSLAMDYGQEGSGVLELPTDGLSAELFDMMGNQVTGLKGSDALKLRLPLGNFPMYVRVPRADAERLAAAFRAGGAACRVEGHAKLRQPKNVPAAYAAGTPDWKKIADVPFKGGSAKFAWSERAFVVRWTSSDGKMPVFVFDTLADERGNAEVGHAGTDENDTVYLLRPKKDAPDMFEVFRREAPDHQLTGGVDRGLLPNVVEPAVEVSSETTGAGRTFTCTFPGRQLEPAMLRTGRRIGFAQDALGFDDTYVTIEFTK